MAKWRQTGTRFRRFLAGAAILTVCACRPSPESSPSAVYEKAWTDFRNGDLQQARTRLESVRSVWERGADPEAARLRLLQAEVLLFQAESQAALPLLKKPVPPVPYLEARRAIDLFDALFRRASREEAARLLQDAANLAEKVPDGDLKTQVAVRRGALALTLRDYDAGYRFSLDAARMAGSRNDPYHQSMALINATLCLIKQSRYDEGTAVGQRALVAAERIGAKRWIGAALGNLSLCYTQLGDFERAVDMRTKAISIQESMKDARLLEQSLGELGSLHLLQGDPRKAAQYYGKSYELAMQLNLRPDASIWAVNQAQSLLEAGAWDEAEHWNNRARELKEEIKDKSSLPFVELNAAAIAQGRGDRKRAAGLYQSVIDAAADNPGLLWSAHAGLAQLANAEGRDRDADTHFRAALRIIEETRSDLLHSEHRITFLSRLIGFYQEYVDALMARGETLDALRIVESSRARILTERLGQSLPARGAAVADYRTASRRTGSAILSFWLAPKRSFLWLVEPDRVRSFELPGSSELDSLVNSYRNTIENSLRNPLEDPAGKRLADALIGQAGKLLPAASSIIVIPDGSLHRLNLETLPVNGHYWLSDVRLAVAPSLEVLLASRPTPDAVRPLLLLGDPVVADRRFPKLKYAAQEMEIVRDHVPGATVLVGDSATPAAYLSSHPEQYRILHFTAHAEAMSRNPLDSAIILSPQGDRYRLSAREVLEHPLHADLVTISGCRSAGVRTYSGEGLIGFAWAFLQTGARTVIAGLWDVNDRSTAALMDNVYSGIAKGMPSPQALRDAKLSFLTTPGPWQSPYYWAAFQAYVR